MPPPLATVSTRQGYALFQDSRGGGKTAAIAALAGFDQPHAAIKPGKSKGKK
jgi:hypothetical protein